MQVQSGLINRTASFARLALQDVQLSGAQADLYETVRATMDSKLREAIEKQGLARSQIMVLDALLKLRHVIEAW